MINATNSIPYQVNNLNTIRGIFQRPSGIAIVTLAVAVILALGYALYYAIRSGNSNTNRVNQLEARAPDSIREQSPEEVMNRFVEEMMNPSKIPSPETINYMEENVQAQNLLRERVMAHQGHFEMNLETFKLLVSKFGLDFLGLNDKGLYCCEYAIASSSSEYLSYIYANRDKIKPSFQLDSDREVYWWTIIGHHDSIPILKRLGADINMKNSKGQNAVAVLLDTFGDIPCEMPNYNRGLLKDQRIECLQQNGCTRP